MKRIGFFLAVILSLAMLTPLFVFADIGSGNMEGGGGGDMGSGTGDFLWNSGDEGVRITVVRDGSPVTTPFDMTNKHPNDTRIHFGPVSKISYNGSNLSLSTDSYKYHNPIITMPRIISTSVGGGNIEAIKQYFCSEYTVKRVSEVTGMDYDTLINGDYKLLIEPVAYFTYNGLRMAMTATEAALYDQQISGNLRSKMGNLTHKNLPLSIFLETADLGYPAWGGTRTGFVTNEEIKSSLGIGIVWFDNVPEAPPHGLDAYDYEYRVNTEVITSVMVGGGQSDPDHPTTVHFSIGGSTYTVSNVYYPSGDSQLAWVRWTTPSTPQDMVIGVTVSGPGSTSQAVINAKIVDLDKNPPPNPVADDRNDSFSPASVPARPVKTSTSWGVWSPWWRAYWVWHSYGDDDDDGYWCDHGWWEFDWLSYNAGLSASMSIMQDARNPTASNRIMKSGYGVNQTVSANVSTNQSSAVTGAQNAVSYFPEFRYEIFWRLLDRSGGGSATQFQFKRNIFSTYGNRTHFTPIWMPDDAYTINTWLIDAWTPAGMLSMNLADSLTISGSLWDDWHIAPLKP